MFSTVKNPEIPAYTEVPNLDFYLKNGLLFGIYEETPHAFIRENPDANMLNALSHLGGRYPVLLLDEESYNNLKNRFLEARSEEGIEEVEGFENPEEIENFLQNEDLLSSENSAPIIRYVNSLFVQAVKRRATDIHIETFEKEGDVRFRIDGVLNKIATLKKGAIESIINRIKVISNLDISETRIPQDGRTKITIAGSGVDVRVSILPTYYGEKVVMRLLMKGESIPSLHNLGFSVEVYNKLKSLLKHSYGMILITGPTGSGKSTTLHSFLIWESTLSSSAPHSSASSRSGWCANYVPTAKSPTPPAKRISNISISTTTRRSTVPRGAKSAASPDTGAAGPSGRSYLSTTPSVPESNMVRTSSRCETI